MRPLTVVVMDCPWPTQKIGNRPGLTYKIMKGPELIQYVVEHTMDFDPCVLFMWTVASLQPLALQALHEAQLALKDDLVWNKLTKHGKKWCGMGWYSKKAHETCKIAVRGTGAEVLPRAYVRSTFEAKVGVHSRKPDEFYQIVEKMYPDARKIEHFARVIRPGWEQSGDQLGAIE